MGLSKKVAPTKIIAVASGGGHWVQLMRIRSAFEGGEVSYLTTRKPSSRHVQGAKFHLVPDCNADEPLRVIVCALHVALRMVIERPDVVITTGAAPGLISLFFGKLMGARTIWIDSIANAEQLSLAGSRARRWADLWLTQWPHLARKSGPQYAGSVI